MGLPQAIKRYTPEEYYRLENEAVYRSDYYNGQILAMSGGTLRHSSIVNNIGGELRSRLKGTPCAPFDSRLRLKVKASGLITYPDASVYCDPVEYDADDPGRRTVVNPTVLFEVLSKSTERFDQEEKAFSYRQIPSLQAYALVSQNSPRIELSQRQPDGSWATQDIEGLDAVLPLRSLAIEVPLHEIYDRVDFAEFHADADDQ